MREQNIENHIDENLTGNARQNALDFVSYLRANDMQFERGSGYWEDKCYWLIKYKNQYVCFILIEVNNLTVWSDDSGSNWFENISLDDAIKETAIRHIDFCGNCGSCSGGTRKMLFGKEFDNVCRTTFRFDNPNADDLVFMKKMMDIRKNDILLR